MVDDETETLETEPDIEEFIPPDAPPKKRYPLLHCPMCGMLVEKRRYELPHPFPNAMERHYGGRSKIRMEYMEEDDELALELHEVAQDQIVNVALTCLGEQHRAILRDSLNDEVKEDD